MRSRTVVLLTLGAALGAFAQIPDFTPPNTFFREVLRNNTEAVKRMLAEGANPNEGRFLGFPAGFFPVISQNLDLLRVMAAKGADLKATDGAGSTTLMWAVMDDASRPEVVQELLGLGVNPNAKNRNGDTALTWALRRGYTPVVETLLKAGASETDAVKAAVAKAIPLLEKSGPEFVKVSGCTSCHNQSLPQMAFAIARTHGFSVNEQTRGQQMKAVAAMFRPLNEAMMKGTEMIPDPPISISYSLVGLAAQGYPADETTRAMAHQISLCQLPDGSFRKTALRPPLESSDFTATALSLRALQVYGDVPANRIQAAARWLAANQPRTHEDRAMQLLGLTWAKGNPESIEQSAAALLAEQRSDGGWSQLPARESDSYATGQALVALALSGRATVSDTAYVRGVGFLLRTQLEDGSWLVRSRAFPFQPYKESGFPHGKDQWISAAGTSWAIMALSLSVPAPEESAALAAGISKTAQ